MFNPSPPPVSIHFRFDFPSVRDGNEHQERHGAVDLFSVEKIRLPFFIPLLYSVTPWVLVILWEKC